MNSLDPFKIDKTERCWIDFSEFRIPVLTTMQEQLQATWQDHVPGEDTFSLDNPKFWLARNEVLSIWDFICNQLLPNNTELQDNSVLEGLFMFRDTEAVVSFMKQHPELPGYLTDSYVVLNSVFGYRAQYFLEMFTNPESNHTHLCVFVRTTVGVDEAMNLMDQFGQQWYLKNIALIGRILSYNLELP